MIECQNMFGNREASRSGVKEIRGGEWLFLRNPCSQFSSCPDSQVSPESVIHTQYAKI